MKALRIAFLLAISSLLAATLATAQAPVAEFPDVSTLTPENIFTQLVDPLFAGLTIVFGYVSALVPGLRRISKFTRVTAFALVVGLGFYLFGVDFWKIVLSYLFATGFYDVLLKKVAPTPKVKPAAQSPYTAAQRISGDY